MFVGTSNNSISFPNLGFFPATAPASKGRLPTYSFSDAKLPVSPAGWLFWRLVSEKNTCVGIPKGINRGALVYKVGYICITLTQNI